MQVIYIFIDFMSAYSMILCLIYELLREEVEDSNYNFNLSVSPFISVKFCCVYGKALLLGEYPFGLVMSSGLTEWTPLSL